MGRTLRSLGRKHDEPPGPKSVWIGLQRIRDFVLVLEALKKVQQLVSNKESVLRTYLNI